MGGLGAALHLAQGRARVHLSDGAEFAQRTGLDTSAHARLNSATTEADLAEMLARLDRVVP
ncbi:hypothetical protein [Kineococcus aurantiacus]|uniref:Bifunctional pyridoxal-dependent enzyme with beta-cystathionase and maltose regulon repressor activities n=1 Tax=Kineococcus aurantiacus TaxID=37633 RepID=A0A7Y9ARD7_9ACTN|nr:hypothetical protein [Kineococcus aurantiacus]NYD20600.1 bifunctional pyridoxal-dependent enzyme with beta-cystathionase and maltose regulon repressor activities [Kineococcus aurantiacus]